VFHGVDAAIAVRLDALDEARVPERIWSGDPTVWKSDPATPEIRDRLGWLTVADAMARQVDDLTAFADDARGEFSRVIRAGWAGRAWRPKCCGAPSALRGLPATAGARQHRSRSVRRAGQAGDIAKTLFLISSKSGTTQESDSFFRHFWEAAGERAPSSSRSPIPALRSKPSRAAALSPHLPQPAGYRRPLLGAFLLRPVPAALLGVDLKTLLDRARRMAQACAAKVPALRNPAAWLGAIVARELEPAETS